jgi:hypothetical protein
MHSENLLRYVGTKKMIISALQNGKRTQVNKEAFNLYPATAATAQEKRTLPPPFPRTKQRQGLKRKNYRKQRRNGKYTCKYGEREERNKYAKQKTMKQRGWKEERDKEKREQM